MKKEDSDDDLDLSSPQDDPNKYPDLRITPSKTYYSQGDIEEIECEGVDE